jgi:hypothetical protein
MTKLKLSYGPWTKGSNYLLSKGNMVITLLWKNEKTVLPPNNSKMTNWSWAKTISPLK